MKPINGSPLPALSPQGWERVAEGRERGGSWEGWLSPGEGSARTQHLLEITFGNKRIVYAMGRVRAFQPTFDRSKLMLLRSFSSSSGRASHTDAPRRKRTGRIHRECQGI